jgi:hypothetical protein
LRCVAAHRYRSAAVQRLVERTPDTEGGYSFTVREYVCAAATGRA